MGQIAIPPGAPLENVPLIGHVAPPFPGRGTGREWGDTAWASCSEAGWLERAGPVDVHGGWSGPAEAAVGCAGFLSRLPFFPVILT